MQQKECQQEEYQPNASYNKKTGALYIRVSTHDQDDLSPDAQKRLLLEYAEKNKIFIPDQFIFVESVSGRNVKKRLEFQRMISMAKSPEHPFSIILVWKYSRFARNQEESIVYKSMLKRDNVEVISVSEPVIDGPFGSLIERIIEWMDEYYSIRLSGEVMRGMKEKALKHGYQTTPPLGYKAVGNGRPFVIAEEEFKIVSFIFSQYDDYSQDCTAIARKCNDLGYRTKRGNLFEKRTIEYILRNPFYVGTVNWNGQSFEGTHEVRYTKEQLASRLKLMDARKRPSNHRNISTCKHWLSGLIKCSVCGATLAYSGTAAAPVFQCWKYAKGIHKTSVSISVNKMENLVMEYFREILKGKDLRYIKKNPPKKADNRLEILQQELSRITTREQRIKAAYENEIDTLEEYRDNKLRLKKQRNAILEEITSLQNEPPELSKDNVLPRIQSVYDILQNPDVSYETKGNFIRTVVNEIVVDKVKGKVYFDMIIS
ncbi:recombinase family protein [Blautia schinkii]|nr:recombinase family protein [Blautia schinkii]